MTLSAGTRLGAYEILAPLGAGGMGEVYRARDARLGRIVALKVLPERVASDPDRLRRFEKEARAASALNHPNIVGIFDVGKSNGISWIAMEWVPGKTLGAVLSGGPLPIKQALHVAVQVADGLARAHEAGVAHRDLKPENLMIQPDGFVKILDFGLAKLTDLAHLSGDGSRSTTQTGPGAILGTVGYMSPEQAAGNPVDFRSDQFSFGAVLYEMATGKRAFRGKTDVDTLAAILNEEPEPISRIRPAAPPPLRWIVERCLAKDPQDRFSSTRDLASDLASLRDHLPELSAEPWRAPTSAFRRRSTGLAVLIATGLALIAALVFQTKTATGPQRPPAVRFTIAPPPGTTFNFGTTEPAPPALSPGGEVLVFGAKGSDGQNELWLRRLDGMAAVPLAGTAGATYPFWSPDGAFLGFFADAKLMKIDIRGGPPQTLADAPDGRGGSWGRDGTILFAPSPEASIARVSSGGGEVTAATRIDPGRTDVAHRWPVFLPDGRHFLYFAHDPGPAGRGGIWIGSLDSFETRRILPDATNAIYVDPGYLVFAREGALFGVPFDAARLRLSGEPVSILKDVRYQPYRWYGVFAASQTGVLVYQSGAALESSRLTWFDRSGKRLGTLGSEGDYEGLRLSPDASRCAVEVRDSRKGTIDLWIWEIARGVTTRLTSGPGIHDAPVWSPDGKRIAFSWNPSGFFDLYQVPSSGGTLELLWRSDAGKSPTDWSSDGRTITFHQSGPGTGFHWEIWELPMPPGTPASLFPRTANERFARFSPDAKWVAYCSDESGTQEVYLRALPGGDRKTRVSAGGGTQPIWRRDGKELYYVGPDNRLMAVEIRFGQPLELGEPRALFEVRVRDTASDSWVLDAVPDGQRFLVNTRLEGAPDPPLSVVLNWVSDLKR